MHMRNSKDFGESVNLRRIALSARLAWMTTGQMQVSGKEPAT